MDSNSSMNNMEMEGEDDLNVPFAIRASAYMNTISQMVREISEKYAQLQLDAKFKEQLDMKLELMHREIQTINKLLVPYLPEE